MTPIGVFAIEYLKIVGHTIIEDKDHPMDVVHILNAHPSLRTLFREAVEDVTDDDNDTSMAAIASLFPSE